MSITATEGPAIEPALRTACTERLWRAGLARTRLRGEESLSDFPRPDKLGLVMKYLWALNGSSPGADFMRVEVPSGKTFQLCSLSLKFATMIWPSTCSCTVGLRIGHKRLDPAVEIARHHVGGRDVDGGLGVRQAVAVAEAVDAAVLEEAADDRFDADVVGEARNARAQAADAAHDEIDRHARAAKHRKARR